MDIRSVLLIDDEADIRRIGELSLARIGKWRVVKAASGAEGVALAAKERPDVILLDVMMPDLDGPATLGRLRADPATRAIPVIFVTAKSAPEDAARLTALGAAGVIAKPFDPMGLPAEVRRIAATLPAGPAPTT